MSFKISLSKEALKSFQKINEPYKSNIINSINKLESNGLNNSNIKLLSGNLIGLYRLRVGNYRIVFQINDLNIDIVTILHRKDSYKD